MLDYPARDKVHIKVSFRNEKQCKIRELKEKPRVGDKGEVGGGGAEVTVHIQYNENM